MQAVISSAWPVCAVRLAPATLMLPWPEFPTRDSSPIATVTLDPKGDAVVEVGLRNKDT
jgi:hypothetical protein